MHTWIPLSAQGEAVWSSWTQLRRVVQRIWQPGVFHGLRRPRRFFEGWYYKLIGPGGQERLAVIPGVALGSEPGESHAFIQVMDAVRRRSDYWTFPLDACAFNPDHFGFRIGGHEFQADSLALAGSSDGDMPEGKIVLHGNAPWPVKVFGPGAMGHYAFAPRLECYHAVLSFRADLLGKMVYRGRKLEFSGGRGYLEKDWGESFPQSYLWLQTNHFARADASLMLSAAKIPWLGNWFAGFVAGFWLENRLYRFATYSGARITRFEICGNGCRLTLADGRHILQVDAQGAESGERLRSPQGGRMSGSIRETLSAVARVELLDVHSGRVRFSGEGQCGGFEREGDLAELGHELTRSRRP